MDKPAGNVYPIDPRSVAAAWIGIAVICLFSLVTHSCAGADEIEPTVADHDVLSRNQAAGTRWSLESPESVGGHPAEVLGEPTAIETEHGAAIEFDGVNDGLQLQTHPLAGADEFTLEILFRPYPDGPREQRFLHLQEAGSKDRLLVELRTTGGGNWFLDTHIESAGEGYTLYAKRFEHEIGRWYHAALVVDGDRMRHFVDGRQELSRKIVFEPPREGRTSIGVRLNRVSWFKGAIREVHFTPRALAPERFVLLGP